MECIIKNDIKLKANDSIQSANVRVIDNDGTNLGVMSIDDALKIATEKDLDLVQVTNDVQCPVCRIESVSKLQYEMMKKMRTAQARSKRQSMKEVKMGYNIADNDFETKVRLTKNFLLKYDRVKVVLMLRGREMNFVENGKKIVQRFCISLSDVGKVDVEPKVERNMIYAILIHK